MANQDKRENGKRETGTAGSLIDHRRQEAGNGNPTELRIGNDIAMRLVALGAEVIRIVQGLPKDVVGRHIGTQLIRAATSGGANYEEARGAESPEDFIHKLAIATKELRESIYWLKLIGAMGRDVAHLLSEANQLCAILSASIRTARQRANS